MSGARWQTRWLPRPGLSRMARTVLGRALVEREAFCFSKRKPSPNLQLVATKSTGW